MIHYIWKGNANSIVILQNIEQHQNQDSKIHVKMKRSAAKGRLANFVLVIDVSYLTSLLPTIIHVQR